MLLQPPGPTLPEIPPVILVVEDDPSTRELYEAAFTLEHFWVAAVADARTALEYVEDLEPNAVITDITLGGGEDGIMLARRLHEKPKTSGIPIFAVTGRDPAALGASADLFTKVLIKPVEFDQLAAAVRTSIAERAALRRRAAEARAKIPDLIAKSEKLIEQSLLLANPLQLMGQEVQPRRCPKCKTFLVWAEQRTVSGVVFDYYRPCRGGCGLFCYDNAQQRFVTLIG